VASKRGEGKTTTMMGADWQRILRIMDEVYADYLDGIVALRERVVDDMRRKLSDSHARRGARSRSSPPTKRR